MPDLLSQLMGLLFKGSSQDASPVDSLTKHCKQCLVSLGKIFRSINEEVLKEVVLDQNFKKQRALRKLRWAQRDQQDNTTHIPWPERSDSLDHLPGDADILESAIKVKIPVPGGDLEELTASLAETSSLRIWKAAAASLLVHQGDSSSVSWHSAKQKALDLLELRQDALEVFKEIVDELRTGRFGSLCEGLTAKLRILERFARIYNRQPIPSTMEHVPGQEALYLYESVPEWRKRKTYPAYPKMQEKVTKLLLPPEHDNMLTNDTARSYFDYHSPCIHTHILLPINTSMEELLKPARIDGRRGLLAPYPKLNHAVTRPFYRHIPSFKAYQDTCLAMGSTFHCFRLYLCFWRYPDVPLPSDDVERSGQFHWSSSPSLHDSAACSRQRLSI